ncbi:MAG TPA: cobalamin-independent methionine synthase II family protein [Casimicrobiaceae bacterium]|nr:cobalamin-independent methionine synthase II family protein [Casimicrobiaceae bacterium]
MPIPTEPIGSIPRPSELIDAIERLGAHHPDVEPLYERAVADTVRRFEATGSTVLSDGEQRKYQNFWTYSCDSAPNTGAEGFEIPFAAGHVRRMLRLLQGPLRFRTLADTYIREAKRHTQRPVKQAVISPSALSLMYPGEGLSGYSRDAFIADLLDEHEREVRACLAAGAHCVQLDFTEGRLAMKIDPSGTLLASFIELNNLALERFSDNERARLGVHTCPGGDRDSTHSADVDYAELLPSLFALKAGNFYIALAGERDPERVLKIVERYRKPEQTVFVGVIAPIDPIVETPECVRDRTLMAARHIPLDRLGTTDDCGFAPFCDDRSTSRETAFAKIASRVQGTAMAAATLGVDG